MPDKVLFKTDWVSLRDRDGYHFLHEDRCQGRIVAFLGILETPSELKILARREYCPAWVEGRARTPLLCSFTGGVDEGETTNEAVLREAQEEASLNPATVEIHHIKDIQSTKSSDTVYSLYVAVLNTETDFEASTEGDGSQSEAEAENVLLSIEEVMDEMVDPIGLSILAFVLQHQKE